MGRRAAPLKNVPIILGAFSMLHSLPTFQKIVQGIVVKLFLVSRRSQLCPLFKVSESFSELES